MLIRSQEKDATLLYTALYFQGYFPENFKQYTIDYHKLLLVTLKYI